MTARGNAELLRVTGLDVFYGKNQVVSNVGFTIHAAEIVALVGQSGSGKSTIANAITHLGDEAHVGQHSSIVLDGAELTALSDKRFRPLRGRSIAYVPQFPIASLNPTRRIGSQLKESFLRDPLKNHAGAVDKNLLVAALKRVGLNEFDRVLSAYPHQLSGGMLQRILIAMAIANGPKLIVADEPTSALDVSLRRTILDLLNEIRDEFGTALLIITHDLSVASARADRVLVLDKGHVVEEGTATEVFEAPQAPYTRKLLASVPDKNRDRYVAARGRRQVENAAALRMVRQIEVRDVSKCFVDSKEQVQALSGVSFEIPRGFTYALVGESGSGKTTMARAILGLQEVDTGVIQVDGEDVRGRSPVALREIRKSLQYVYQDGNSSLDPLYPVIRSVAEPLKHFGVEPVKARRLQRAGEVLELVGIERALHHLRPTKLSGGQRQRVAIARAIATHPKVVILDEPTSALDVFTQTQITDLLFKIQIELGLTYLLVSHDLGLVRQFADYVSVMKDGKIVESGTVEQIYGYPQDDYTRMLIQNSLL